MALQLYPPPPSSSMKALVFKKLPWSSLECLGLLTCLLLYNRQLLCANSGYSSVFGTVGRWKVNKIQLLPSVTSMNRRKFLHLMPVFNFLCHKG